MPALRPGNLQRGTHGVPATIHPRRFAPIVPATQRTTALRAPRAVLAGRTDIGVVWGLLFAITVAVLFTYSTTPTTELYHVSRDGLIGGLSRAVTHLNFPGAFLAIALGSYTSIRLLQSSVLSQRRRSGVNLVSVLMLVLCLVTAFPGVVDQGDLDARWVNAIPVVGVVLALGLTLYMFRAVHSGTAWRWTRYAVAATGVAVLLFVLALPWILADVSIYIGDIPLIGGLYYSKEIVAGHTLRAVHLGHHHGLDGVLFAVSALLLLRPLHVLRSSRMRTGLALYVAFMLVYGLANFFQDFWGEQIVKRGWSDRDIPSVLRPEVTPAWAMLLVATALVYTVLRHSLQIADGRTGVHSTI